MFTNRSEDGSMSSNDLGGKRLHPLAVIASEAKQSSAEAPHWIASSLRSSQ
jgi:hypothetical protein